MQNNLAGHFRFFLKRFDVFGHSTTCFSICDFLFQVSGFVEMLSAAASILNLTAVSIERSVSLI